MQLRSQAARLPLVTKHNAIGNAAQDLVVFNIQEYKQTIFYLQIFLVGLLGACWYIWWNVLVPQERTRLSKDKRKGELKDYIEGIEADESKRFKRWLFTKWRKQLVKRKPTVQTIATGSQSTAVTASYNALPTQATGNANSNDYSKQVPPAVDEPLIPLNKRRLPKFFSFDNPVLVLLFTITMLTLASGAVRQVSGDGTEYQSLKQYLQVDQELKQTTSR